MGLSECWSNVNSREYGGDGPRNEADSEQLGGPERTAEDDFPEEGAGQVRNSAARNRAHGAGEHEHGKSCCARWFFGMRAGFVGQV